MAAGDYDGGLRELILAYKEGGRRGLAAPLGYALARAIMTGEGGRRGAPPRLLVVPVPATAAAVRARHGDHMLRIARQATLRLRRVGWPVSIATPLRALRKPDSAHLDRHARAVAASTAFAVRPGRLAVARNAGRMGAHVVLVDDVLTTGATLAAVARLLADAHIPVAYAATIAATHLRYDTAGRGGPVARGGVVARGASLSPIAQISPDGYRDGGDGRAGTS